MGRLESVTGIFDRKSKTARTRLWSPEVRKLIYGRTFFSCTALNKSLSYRFLFFLDNKQETISKVHVCQKKRIKVRIWKIFTLQIRENLNQLAEHQKLKKMLVIGGITIICLVVTRSWNYIGNHCVIVKEDVHEKIKKDEQFCLKEYQKDLRTVSWISMYIGGHTLDYTHWFWLIHIRL